MRKPVIFISYSHLDEPEYPRADETQWLSLVVGYLRAAFPNDGAEIWLDRLLPGGADWNAEIERKLKGCDAFVLLVSHHALQSKYIVEKEIAAIRERQANGEKVLLFPLLLTPTPKTALKLIDDRVIRPRDGKPLSGFSAHERMRLVNEAAEEIVELLERRNGAPSATAPPVHFENTDQLKEWMKEQSRETVMAIAARTALRVLPHYRPSRVDAVVEQRYLELTLSLFRANSLARFAAKYPSNFVTTRSAVEPAVRDALTAAANASGDSSAAAAYAAAFAADTCLYDGVFSVETAAVVAADAVAAAVDVASGATAWRAIFADAPNVDLDGAAHLMDRPLWPTIIPNSEYIAWREMENFLPKNQDWTVWFVWYEDGLLARTRSKEYELAFVDWPDEFWKQDPATINRKIAERLAALPPDLPDSIPDFASPVTFDWNAGDKVDSIPGAQNLPLFPHASSEEDRRFAIDVCRKGATRLLATLRDNRLFNVAPSYEIVLADYLEDLPATAGVGNILLARDRALILAAMLQRDAAELPEHFAIQLGQVVNNQRALDPFYDLVQRHDEAVAKSKWTAPFPFEAARDVIAKVANSPEIFEPGVGADLGRVEAAAPPEAPARPATGDAAPAPLELARSHQRQIGASINAMWKVFKQGPDVLKDTRAWSEVGHNLADSVGQVLDWLRSLGG